jgi:hypothetical protein
LKKENRDQVQINCRDKITAHLFYEVEDELLEKGVIRRRNHADTLHQILKDRKEL